MIKLRAGDIIEVDSSGHKNLRGLVYGFVDSTRFYFFNNKMSGGFPIGVDPKDYGYKYSYVLRECNSIVKRIIEDTADEYNKRCFKLIESKKIIKIIEKDYCANLDDDVFDPDEFPF